MTVNQQGLNFCEGCVAARDKIGFVCLACQLARLDATKKPVIKDRF